MGGKTAIATGLVTGIVAGGLVLGGVLLLTPPPTVPVATDPPPPTGAPSPSASAVPGGPASAAPSELPSASPVSPAPSPAATPVPSASGGETGLFGVGEPAPALRLARVGGGEIDLAGLRGRPVWVNFMATYCPSCIDELPSMAGFAARYEDTGLAVVVVDVREDEAAVKAFMDQLGVRFPVGLDADGNAQAAWGALALPVHYWVDAEGVVRDGALGGIGPDVMADGLQKILPGVEVTP